LNPDEATIGVSEALNERRIPFILAGGYSSNFYGIPRTTHDADFVVRVSAAEFQDLPTALGRDFERIEQLSFETNTGTLRQEFQVRGTRFKVEVFKLSGDPHDQASFGWRVEADFGRTKIFLPTAEDVVIWKLRWGRPEDKEDVRNVLTVQRGKVEWPYIEQWCMQHGTFGLLNQIRETVPEI
jgi:hypothetical protein